MANHWDAASKAVMRALSKEATERAAARKLREARLARLGVIVEQLMMRGDAGLTTRLEKAALECFPSATRYRRDREVLGLETPGATFFDECRTKAQAAAAAKRPAESNGPEARVSQAALGAVASAESILAKSSANA